MEDSLCDIRAIHIPEAADASTRLQALLDASDDAIVELTPDNRIVSWNFGAEQILGYPAEEVMGRSVNFLVAPDSIDEAADLLSRALRGELIRNFEAGLLKRDERIAYVSLNVHPIRDAAGDTCGILAIARDISEFRRTLARQHSLVHALIAAQEEERRRVAYDLHDGLTQFVMASHAHLETFRHAQEAKDDAKAGRELEHGLRYLKEAIVESRRLVNGLRTLALDNMTLAGALEQLLNDEKVRAGWQEAYLVHNTGNERFDKILSTAVFRVAQEALTNVRKHAATARVRMMLLEVRDEQRGTQSVTLEVRDWGQGFDPKQQIEAQDHVGLQSMVERVRLLEGTYNLQSTPGEGTVVRVSFPVQQ